MEENGIKEDNIERYSLVIIKLLGEIKSSIVATIGEIIDGMPNVMKNTSHYHDLQVRLTPPISTNASDILTRDNPLSHHSQHIGTCWIATFISLPHTVDG